MEDKLANEIMDAANGTGSAVKRKEDTDYEKEKHSEDCTL
jgi:ribosomal protein S7